MRIIIEIEGTETTVKTAQSDTVVVQVPSASPASAHVAPLEIRAAAAIGAIDAGPAPHLPTQSSTVPSPPPSTDAGAPLSGPGALPAGAAPATLLQESS